MQQHAPHARWGLSLSSLVFVTVSACTTKYPILKHQRHPKYPIHHLSECIQCLFYFNWIVQKWTSVASDVVLYFRLTMLCESYYTTSYKKDGLSAEVRKMKYKTCVSVAEPTPIKTKKILKFCHVIKHKSIFAKLNFN